MKKSTLALWALIVAAVPPAASQERECGEWRIDWLDPHKMHWVQHPWGFPVSLGQVTLADDFLCTETGPIRDVHVWGAFLNDVRPEGGAESLRLELTIYADVPATEDRWSRPGVRQWRRVFEPGEYIVTVGPGGGGWYDPESGNLDQDHSAERGVQYTFCIEEEPFVQEEGTIYWLGVKDLSANSKEYTFGWQSTLPDYHWNDAAVYRVNERVGWSKMSFPEGTWWEGEPLDLAFVISNGEASPKRDLGDAPDSSNSFPGATMTAYDGVPANFPTVYLAGSPPHGPMHLQPRDRFFLGQEVSLENEADVGLDEDWGPHPDLPYNNLLPLSDMADQETNNFSRRGVRWYDSDDGLVVEGSWPVSFPACQRTRLDYRVTVTDANAASAYVNVWCDWNRDGDWDDTLVCAGRASVPEWAVQNDTPAFTGASEYVFTSPSFRCWHPEGRELDPMWVRITIAEQEWTPQANGGAGPEGGYQYGETEDYLLPPVPRSPLYDWGDAPDSLAASGYPVLSAHNGARHAIGGPWLGGSDSNDPNPDEDGFWGEDDENPQWGAGDNPDSEGDGQPDDTARGDDKNRNDDEDGVSIPALAGGGSRASGNMTIQVSGGGGVVQAWIDFDSDKVWEDAEKILDAFQSNGVHVISFGVPAHAIVGKTFARVRISTAGGLKPDGLAGDGEVEDHEVEIVSLPATILPGAVTQCPAVATQCPTVLTQCPPVQTQCPSTQTQCPTTATACPPQTTGCPVAATSCPPTPTRCPAESTKCPPQTTGCPVVQTQCPSGATACPVVATSCPPAQTQCPAESTKCPPVQTSCPAESTKCPPVTTQCPTVQTNCPPTTTQCPAVETRCPVTSTACPVKQTACPSINTKCPPSSTQCPVSETTCPLTPTNCAIVYTECPALETRCPPVETKCPVSSTKCPPVSTSCPPVQTLCPATPTFCPPLLTICPRTPTKCFCPLSESDLEPVGGTDKLPSSCPVIETDCPGIVEYLVTGMARQRAKPR